MRTTSSWWLLSMAEVFKRQGLPLAQLFADSGLALQALAHQQARFPQDGVTRLWNHAEVFSGNDHIGLDVGSRLSLAGFPVLAYTLMTAKGPVDGFQRFLRYQRMIGQAANIRVLMRNGELVLDFHFSGDEIPVSRHTIDAAMAAMVNMARLLAGEHWHPKAVYLQRDIPRNPDNFSDWFQCPVHFRAAADQLVLDLAQFAQHPEKSASDSAWQASMLAGSRPTAELVAMLVAGRLEDGGLSKDSVAKSLNMTPRTLQRRLSAEGVTFQSVVDRVRRERAQEALANPLMQPIDVAFLCGFSDLTAFHHAFRRWCGMTPGEYRASILGNSGESFES